MDLAQKHAVVITNSFQTNSERPEFVVKKGMGKRACSSASKGVRAKLGKGENARDYGKEDVMKS